MTDPTIYRRRSPLFEAYEITETNVWDLAELLGGRVDTSLRRPRLHLPKSMQPARIGDYAVHELTRDDPWFPYRADLFRDGHEPATCTTCGTVQGG